MVDNSSFGGAAGIPPAGSTGPAQAGQRAADEAARTKGGPAFQAMLDQLQAKSKSLSADSASVEKPEDLSGAVNRAKSTLTDALSLSDQLLEAFRQASQGSESDSE
ncbi:MAG: hypothetical protein ACI9F9_000514 [Candidatus Paceibacteria bacterium]|jgi:hypothetical protein